MSIPIILASSSPRRKQLLADYSPLVSPPDTDVEDGIHTEESPYKYVSRLALQKGKNVAQKFSGGIIVACDTVGLCAGEILGKPSDEEDARRMLRLLRGSEHQVISGLCVIKKISQQEKITQCCEVTRLYMLPISDEKLEQYITSKKWVGKAGAFGYQDGIDWIKIIEGSESNVVGLPMERLAEILSLETRCFTQNSD